MSPTAVRVLHVQSDPTSGGLVRRHLDGDAAGLVVETVGTGEACITRALAEPFDVLLVDHPLPDGSALDLVRAARASGLALPVVVVIRHGEEETGLEALRLGADDYLVQCPDGLGGLGLALRKAVARHRMLAGGRAREERLATLLRFGQRLAAHRPHDDLLPLVAEEARQLLGAPAAALRLVDGDELGAAVVAGDGARLALPPKLRIGEGPCGRVAAAASPLRIDDPALSPPAEPDAAALSPAGSGAYLGVPLLVRDRVIGVLSVYAAASGRFAAADASLLAAFAAQAAVAVENARLVDQLLHAERLSAVGRIVAGVAHELNNPLAVVIGTADLLRREGVEERVAERLSRISGQAQRAAKIVRSLLTLARRKPPQRTEVDVNQLLVDTLELEALELRRAQLVVIRKLDPSLPPLVGDADQLQQVFTNLVLNASEAMHEAHGGGTLTVATGLDAGTSRIVLTVEDDGPGIAPHDLPRVFEPFFTTKSEGKGTGLGLALCRQIVEGLGGRISVESRPGAGAAFTVELPATSLEVRRSPAPARPERPTARGAAVLLVEDEPVVGDLLAEFLSLDGHQVDRATNGREALELVKARPYGLIVSDVRMPDGDGPSFYRQLRTVDPDLGRRVVFVTGDVMSAETRRFLDETGLAFLEKPFGIGEFQAAVRAALAQDAAPSARPAQTA